ncbi:hypothetical protein B0H21DRAFT_775794 [Amylocystis lapponica]|nr:hypothetical protein B0H21DRAFT_775794 [Amylocystis lapponica]
MAPRRRCPVCGSKQWHKEPSSGLITCSEGHVLQNYRNEAREVDEMGPHMMRKRTLKSRREKKEKRSRADPKLYHGDRARYHYFQCLQLILRMQVAALVELWELPSEFEVVCRDIWALHLHLLPNPPPAEPLYFARDEADMHQADGSAQARTATSPDNSDGETGEKDSGKDLSASSSSESESEDDAEMEQLMRENSGSSSSSEEDADYNTNSIPRKEVVRKKRLHRQYDAPASNIAVLMVACWSLRLPVMYMDFIRLIEAYKLPYLDTIRSMPATLTTHLTKHTAHALSPHYAPTPLHLHRLASRLARLMNSSYGIFTPELNAAPILWRAVRGLCGTPTLYMLAKRVARVLSIPLTLHRSLAPGLKRTRKNDPDWHKYDNAVPEVALAASAIIVLKMVYGLDGKVRSPQDKNDMGSALPRVSDYLACLDDMDKATQARGSAFSADSQMTVLDLSNAELDSYLDFCERILLPPEDRRTGHGAPPPDSGQGPLPAEFPKLSANVIEAGDRAMRPGECYNIYSTADVLGSVPADYEAVVRRAGHWAGVDEDYVCGVVERFERRFVRWWDGVKRQEREERGVDDGVGAGFSD